MIGFLLIIVPGLILITIWSVAAPVVVLERPGVFAALGRSRELVRGNGWQVFGVIFVLVLPRPVRRLGASRSPPTRPAPASGIVARVVVGVLTAPLSALAAAVLYFELRRRRPARRRRGRRAGAPAMRRPHGRRAGCLRQPAAGP